MSLGASPSSGRRLLGGAVKLAIALAIAEVLVRYGMSHPAFGRRLEQYGTQGWLISQMAQYEAGGGWLHHRFPLEGDPNLGWTDTLGSVKPPNVGTSEESRPQFGWDLGSLLVACPLAVLRPPCNSLAANLPLLGFFSLIGFLWFAASGYFGFATGSRADWAALLPLVVGLIVTEGLTRHAPQEIEMYFYWGEFPGRHSVVHPLYEMFIQGLGGDPYLVVMHVNGVIGALAVLPLYVFVQQRTASRTAALSAGFLFALQPIIVEFAPTDGPYSLMFLTWFTSLALLGSSDPGPMQLIAAGALLGIAGTSRAEGLLYLCASLLLINLGALLATMRRRPLATLLGFLLMIGFVALQVVECFPKHIAPGQTMPNVGTTTWQATLRAGLWSVDYNNPIFVGLVLTGAFAGITHRRYRLGLGAALATLIVVWPMALTINGGFTSLHRLVMTCGLQSIAAGVGAAFILDLVLPRLRDHVAVSVPVLLLALFFLVLQRHEIHDPNAVSEEFWMVREQLAPGGTVKSKCTLLRYGVKNTWANGDIDIHSFEQVLPGMRVVHCESDDCLRPASEGGCVYYVRAINSFYRDDRETPPECVERGRTPAGDPLPCMDPAAAQLERSLELSQLDERTVDIWHVWSGRDRTAHFPHYADIGIFRVTGLKRLR